MEWFYGVEKWAKYPDLPWDFGLWQDALSLKRGRMREDLFVEWAVRKGNEGSVLLIREALPIRREVTQGFRSMCAQRPPSPPPRPSQDGGLQQASINSIDADSVNQGDGIKELWSRAMVSGSFRSIVQTRHLCRG